MMQTPRNSSRSVPHANGSLVGSPPMQHCFHGRHIRARTAVQPRQTLYICYPLQSGARPLQPARFQPDHASEIQMLPVEKKAATGFKEGVVIIGGGPAGLTAAMIMAQRGWTDITVVEKRQDVLEEIVDRSYVYRVDGRGLKLLNRISKLDDEIDKYALPMEKINMTVVKPDSRTVNASFDAKFMGLGGRWLPRTTLLRLLYEDGLKLGRVHGWASAITILEGTTMAAMEREPLEIQGEWRLKVTLSETATGKQQVLRPHLVIGADGINSVVRHTLEQWETEDTPDVQPGATHRFAMQEYASPSAGLRYKVMRLPADPPLTKAEQPLRVDSNSVAVLEGMAEPDTQFKLRLGLLPVKDNTLPRSANFILPSKGHKLLDIKDMEQMYQYLESQLPQFPVRSLLPPAEVARFASSRGGRFPAPQHVNALQTSVRTPSQGADAQGYGVVLLGDARAVFPPDCGQGVNSAFEDVMEFEKALAAAGDNLPEALQQYESNRLPDIKALINIMTFAAPYQYNQEIMGSTLWTLNFILRTVLNKLAPAVFAPQAVLLVQQSDLNYREVLKRVNATTQYIVIGAALLAALPLVAITLPK